MEEQPDFSHCGMAVGSVPGARYLPGCLEPQDQRRLLGELGPVLEAAPLYRPRMPRSGRPFSVRMTNCGPLGWVSDRSGYRYQPTHPETGKPWPPMPALLLDLWAALTGFGAAPEACLINHYDAKARLGLHRDEDEEDFSAPVLSLSLGDTALFRLGGLKRKDPTRSLRLASGDALILGGEARLAYHGIDRVLAGTSELVPDGGRINLTLRRVSRAD